MGRVSTMLVALAAMLAAAMPASAAGRFAAPLPTPPGTMGPAGDAATACDRLGKHDFSTVADAPSLIVSAVVVEGTPALPKHCLVNGRIAPTISYRAWLPLDTWNGKFVQGGCGGRCGFILNEGCEVVLSRGYACIAADLGHSGTMYDNLWAIDNVPGEIDFGFRATHVTNVTGRAIVAQFYGRPPRWAYYIGASTGGRQGLVEAQRFPADFDGIVAGEPAMGPPGTPEPETGPALRAAVQALLADGRPVVTPAEIMTVHDAAIARCDMDDNLKDGIISDPRRCDFRPAMIVCKEPKTNACLTEAQAAAVARTYAQGALPGSEKAWIGAYIMKDGTAGRYGTRWGNDYRYPYAWIFNDATNPDLRAFKARGGKLILYQGWADEACFPGNPVDYYETVERLMGGRATTQDFFRLYMIPGQSHIPVGAGAETVDYLSYMEAWVERGIAPDVLVGAKMKTLARFAGPVTYKDYLTPGNIAFTRPVWPYPVQARYRGRGDPNAADSFVPVVPRKGA